MKKDATGRKALPNLTEDASCGRRSLGTSGSLVRPAAGLCALPMARPLDDDGRYASRVCEVMQKQHLGAGASSSDPAVLGRFTGM